MKTAQLNDMYLTRSNTFYQPLKFIVDKQPFDLSILNKIEVDVRKGITRQGKLIKKLIIGDGLEIVGEHNEVLIIKILPEITDTMAGGKYYLDIQVEDEENNIFTYAWGQIIVRENITD